MAFWHGDAVPDDFFGEVAIPPVDGVLLNRLGNLPFWRGNKPLQEIMAPIYPQASRKGLELFLGNVTGKDQDRK